MGCLAGCGASLDSGNGNFAAVGTKKAVDKTQSMNVFTDPAKKPGAAKKHIGAKQIFTAAKNHVDAYEIGPHDELDIQVMDVPELSGDREVTDEGTIDYPLIGDIQVAGKTVPNLKRELTKMLGSKYLQSPKITISIKEYKSQRFTVEGEVEKPGVYTILGRTSLMQAIAMAQGMNDVSDAGDIVVFRTVGGKRHAAKFDLNAIRKGSAPDPEVRRGDVIIVGTSYVRTVWRDLGKITPLARFFTPF